MTIGQRAAEAIKGRSERTGMSLAQTCAQCGCNYVNLQYWRSGEGDPGAYFLAGMYKAGYDIGYILTGEKA